MGLFGKRKENEDGIIKNPEPRFVEITINHKDANNDYFTINILEEYSCIKSIQDVIDGTFKHCTITDADGDKIILSHDYLCHCIITIRY